MSDHLSTNIQTLPADFQPRQHIKKQRHYFANKGPSSQGYGFPVVMYGCESWTVKKASAEELMLLSCGVGEDS